MNESTYHLIISQVLAVFLVARENQESQEMLRVNLVMMRLMVRMEAMVRTAPMELMVNQELRDNLVKMVQLDPKESLEWKAILVHPVALGKMVQKEHLVTPECKENPVILDQMAHRDLQELQENQETRESLGLMESRESLATLAPTERTVKMEKMEHLALNLERKENQDLKDLKDPRGRRENLVQMVRPELLPQCSSLVLKGNLVAQDYQENKYLVKPVPREQKETPVRMVTQAKMEPQGRMELQDKMVHQESQVLKVPMEKMETKVTPEKLENQEILENLENLEKKDSQVFLADRVSHNHAT